MKLASPLQLKLASFSLLLSFLISNTLFAKSFILPGYGAIPNNGNYCVINEHGVGAAGRYTACMARTTAVLNSGVIIADFGMSYRDDGNGCIVETKLKEHDLNTDRVVTLTTLTSTNGSGNVDVEITPVNITSTPTKGYFISVSVSDYSDPYAYVDPYATNPKCMYHGSYIEYR